jgi:two-component system, cell cycle response regulator DivK
MFSSEVCARAAGHGDGKVSRLIRAPEPLVLVAEDHEDTRHMLRAILEMKGCRVVEACDGLQAVAVAGREQPDLIIMDGSLPLLDSLVATRLIRGNALLSKVFIVALNGWGTLSFHDAALAAGCNDCLNKPIDFERLESHLVRLFGETQPVA